MIADSNNRANNSDSINKKQKKLNYLTIIIVRFIMLLGRFDVALGRYKQMMGYNNKK